MATILEVIQNDVAPVIGLAVPTAVFGSTEREHVELQNVANSVATEMMERYDWQRLKAIATITGDGTTEDWDFPTDYNRQTLKSTLWVTSRPFYPLEHVIDFDMWLGIVTSAINVTLGQWIIYGGQVHVRPAIASADTAKYPYIKNAMVDGVTGADKATFTLDTDTFLLDNNSLGLGIIAAWRQQKGLPYAEDMASYEQAIARAIARDKGSKILVVGNQRMRSGLDAQLAWPGTLGP